MKIIIFGASGRTGRHMIVQSLEQGHMVTAFARTPSKITTSHKNLRIVPGNVLDAASVEQAMQEGHDVVFCTLGFNRDEPTTVLAEGTQNIIRAMEKHNTRRIIVISAAGFMGERADFLLGKVLFWGFGWMLQKLFDAMKRQYQELEKSNLDWIAIRPFLLDEGPRKGNYRVVLEDVPSKGYRINTGDLAEFMLKQSVSDKYVRKAPAIAY